MSDASAPTPAWVKVFAIIAVILLVAFVVSLLLGVEHGPGGHGTVRSELL
jgi:hypothetical protein